MEPYLAAAVTALAGSSLGVLTVTMATLSGLALLGVYAVLRRLVRAPLPALALFGAVPRHDLLRRDPAAPPQTRAPEPSGD